MISKGARVQDKTKKGFSALFLASQYGHIQIVDLLISKGANINDRNSFGYSALIAACRENGHLDVIKLLLSKGANMHDRTNSGHACSSLTKGKEVKILFKKWDVTMVLIVLQKLCVLSGIDPSSFIDLKKFMG